jgi:hypothetical protein
LLCSFASDYETAPPASMRQAVTLSRRKRLRRSSIRADGAKILVPSYDGTGLLSLVAFLIF